MIKTNSTKSAKHHLVVKQTVVSDGSSYVMPMLYFQQADEAVERLDLLVEYYLAYTCQSYDWMNFRAQALGLLWDYTQAQDIDFDWSNSDSHRIIFRHFQLALLNGTFNSESTNDPLGLYWGRTPKDKVINLMSALQHFTIWCHDEGYKSNLPIDTRYEISPDTFISFIYIARYLKEVNFMAHLMDEKQIGLKLFNQHRANPAHFDAQKPLVPYFDPVKAFPRSLVQPFLDHGFVIDPLATEPHNRLDITGKMIALLLFYGGLRRSEPLHIWFNDVLPTNEGCEVVLAHPQYANARIGNSTESRRWEYLTIRGLSPRNLAKNNKSFFAGWKDLLTDAEHIAHVFWIDNDAEQLFREMFLYYLKYRQNLIKNRLANGHKDHPFLFVSNGLNEHDHRGAPYSYAAFEKSWNRALKRTSEYLGKELKQLKSEGLTPHGPRHFYGTWLAESGVDEKTIQVCMHHKSPLSQRAYTQPSLQFIHQTLSAVKN